MRLSRYVIGGSLVGSTGLAVGLACSKLADELLKPSSQPRYRSEITAVVGDEIWMRADSESKSRGTFGLQWPGGRGVVGDVLGFDSNFIYRTLLKSSGSSPVPGPAKFGHVHWGDPASSVGLEFQDLMLESDVGLMPAWVVPGQGGTGATWAVLCHGWGETRERCLSYLPMLNKLGISSIVPSLRNDEGAPQTPDGRCRLGAEEWRDIDAAIEEAISRGAKRVVLFGWSLGGQAALQAYAWSLRRSFIGAIILDSPVLDWRSVLIDQARRRKIPQVLAKCVMRIVEARAHLDLDDLDWVRRADELDVPVLVIHGPNDTLVPWQLTMALAKARPMVVEVAEFEDAGHVSGWNLDPTRYEDVVSSYLKRLAPIWD